MWAVETDGRGSVLEPNPKCLSSLSLQFQLNQESEVIEMEFVGKISSDINGMLNVR